MTNKCLHQIRTSSPPRRISEISDVAAAGARSIARFPEGGLAMFVAMVTLSASVVFRMHRRDALCAGGAAALFHHQPAIAAAALPPPIKKAFTWEEVPGLPSYTLRGQARTYALVTHANGIRGLVCSDSELSRCELALTVPCGSLSDPRDLEGLAHLSEHITIAADPMDLASFVDDREGDTNAFTGERTTTFYTGIDLNKRVARTPSASSAVAAIEATTKEDVTELATRFAGLFRLALSGPPATTAPLSIIKQEIRRVDAELGDIAKRCVRHPDPRHIGSTHATSVQPTPPSHSHSALSVCCMLLTPKAFDHARHACAQALTPAARDRRSQSA